MKKKIISLFLSIALLVAACSVMAACGEEQTTEAPVTTTEATTTEATTTATTTEATKTATTTVAKTTAAKQQLQQQLLQQLLQQQKLQQQLQLFPLLQHRSLSTALSTSTTANLASLSSTKLHTTKT